MDTRPFWERKKLEELTHDGWESLCDACGRCCLKKLEDEEVTPLRGAGVSVSVQP